MVGAHLRLVAHQPLRNCINLGTTIKSVRQTSLSFRLAPLPSTSFHPQKMQKPTGWKIANSAIPAEPIPPPQRSKKLVTHLAPSHHSKTAPAIITSIPEPNSLARPDSFSRALVIGGDIIFSLFSVCEIQKKPNVRCNLSWEGTTFLCKEQKEDCKTTGKG